MSPLKTPANKTAPVRLLPLFPLFSPFSLSILSLYLSLCLSISVALSLPLRFPPKSLTAVTMTARRRTRQHDDDTVFPSFSLFFFNFFWCSLFMYSVCIFGYCLYFYFIGIFLDLWILFV